MKNLILLVVAFSTGLFVKAQENTYTDNSVEKRTVKPFRSIKVGDGIDLYLSQGNEESVAVSASKDEFMDRLKTEVEDGVLKIYYERASLNNWTVSNNKRLKAYVSFKTLDKLTASSGSEVIVKGIIKEEVMSLFVSSGANFKGTVEAGKLIVEAESGAKIEIDGRASVFTVTASSGAKIEAYSLEAGKADVRSSSGAKIEVTAKDEMKLSSSSGGSIHYKGNPKITELNTRFGSVIHKQG
jgi:hypothetical protein